MELFRQDRFVLIELQGLVEVAQVGVGIPEFFIGDGQAVFKADVAREAVIEFLT